MNHITTIILSACLLIIPNRIMADISSVKQECKKLQSALIEKNAACANDALKDCKHCCFDIKKDCRAFARVGLFATKVFIIHTILNYLNPNRKTRFKWGESLAYGLIFELAFQAEGIPGLFSETEKKCS